MIIAAAWMLTILHKHEQIVEQAMYLNYICSYQIANRNY